MKDNVFHKVINSWLFSVGEESYFSWEGCDLCDERSGNDVYDAKGYTDLETAKNDKENYYEFRICGECLNLAYYGE